MRAVWAMVLAYSCGVGLWVLHRVNQGYNCTFDLGIHDQAVWLVKQGLNPLLTSRGLQVQADHFSPMAYLLAPLYHFWDDPKALLILQTVWIASGAFPTYHLARRHLQSERLCWALAGMYLLQPCLTFMNLFDFHFSALMTTPLLWACYGLDSGQMSRYYCALLTALATSETVPMSMLGLVPVVWWKRGWRHGLATLLLAIGGLLACLNWVRWHNSGQATQYTSLYSEYGGSAREVVQTLVMHPVQTLSRLNTETNRDYALQMLAPLAFTPLLGPLEALPAAPVLAGNLLSWRSSQHSIRYHYQAGVLPFFVWAACIGWARLERRHGARKVGWGMALTCIVAFLVGPSHPEEWDKPVPQHQQALRELGRVIPPGASLSAENTLGGVFSHRQRAYLFPNPIQAVAWGSRPQALIDQTGMGIDPYLPGRLRRSLQRRPVDFILAEPGAATDFPMGRPDRDYYLGEICAAPEYGLIYARNGVVAFQAGHGRRYGPWVLPLADYYFWRWHIWP